MKVKELIKELKNFNPNIETHVVAHNRNYKYSISWACGDGGTKKDADSVSLYVDDLCSNDIIK